MPSSDKSVIVIVDHDEAVLTSLHSFFSLESDYNIFVFTKAKEALDFIQNNATDVVVTEHYWVNLKGRRIGEGLPFLSKVKTISPHTTRIILATIVDKEMIIHAINDVGVFQIIEKPWDNDKLKIVIEKGLMKSKKSKDLVERTRKEITETSHYEPPGRGRVVVVDDDEIVLTSLRSMFELKSDHDIKTFTRPKEALIYLRNNEVDIIITDYLMPEMDGISFLAEVKKMAPHCPGILLTGYADRENAQRAVNELGLYHCIEKPWDNEDLCIVVRNGIEIKRLYETLYKKKEHKKELVFIAYAREDKEFALSLAKILKTNEINIWVDKWNIPLSSDWDKCIDDALEICTKLLGVLSKASVNSEEFRAELRQALDGGKSIIPVLYKECKIPRRLTLIQNVDFTQTTLEDMSKINQLLSILRDDMEYDWALF